MKEVSLIVATSTEYGIGYDNKISWNIPEEMVHFKNTTTKTLNKDKKNCIIMGKNTWMSLPRRPLRDRINIVITSEESSKILESVSKNTLQNDNNELNDLYITNNIIDAMKYAYQNENIEKIFIIGGAQLYNTFLENYVHIIDKIHLSIIYDKTYVCNKFIDSKKIYESFNFDKENIHFTEKYVYMIGYNKNKPKVIDEDVL